MFIVTLLSVIVVLFNVEMKTYFIRTALMIDKACRDALSHMAGQAGGLQRGTGTNKGPPKQKNNNKQRNTVVLL